MDGLRRAKRGRQAFRLEGKAESQGLCDQLVGRAAECCRILCCTVFSVRGNEVTWRESSR